jgi:hypothetical protein
LVDSDVFDIKELNTNVLNVADRDLKDKPIDFKTGREPELLN